MAERFILMEGNAMNLLNNENEIKLDILRSLARSQRALSKMLECAAEFPSSKISDKESLRQIALMSRYQQILAERITGLCFRRKQFGRPNDPWINCTVNLYKNKKLRR